MSQLDDAIDRAIHALKQAKEAPEQRSKVGGMVSAHDDLYRTLGAFYEAKTKAMEARSA